MEKQLSHYMGFSLTLIGFHNNGSRLSRTEILPSPFPGLCFVEEPMKFRLGHKTRLFCQQCFFSRCSNIAQGPFKKYVTRQEGGRKAQNLGEMMCKKVTSHPKQHIHGDTKFGPPAPSWAEIVNVHQKLTILFELYYLESFDFSNLLHLHLLKPIASFLLFSTKTSLPFHFLSHLLHGLT